MNIHGRGIERKMPTGMAWHGETLKAIYEAIGGEFQLLETDLNDRCNADNQLLGEGLAYWEKALGLPGTGTIAERQAAVKQRLGGSGGITVAAITEALHRAGFTNLFAHPNYEYLPLTVEATPMGLTTQMGEDTQMSYSHIYTDVVDPAIFEAFLSYLTMGFDTQMGAGSQMGYGAGAQGIVVNNLQDDSFAQIPANPAAWTGVFFVGGENKFEVASVPVSQREALRLLLQTVKPFNTAAILLVEYVYSGSVEITSPAAYSRIFIGDSFTVSGISDLADGTQITLVIVYPDSTEEPYDVTTITDGEFSFGDVDLSDDYGTGYATLKVNAEHASAEVLIRLALHGINITSPADGAGIRIGTTVTIAGTTDFAEDSIITIKSVVGGTETTIGTAVVSSGAFTYSWIANGDPGEATIKASAGVITATVDILLASAFIVDEPEENDPILPDVSFYAEVSGCSDGDVKVYYGDTLLTTFTASEGIASGNVTIPGRLLGGGYAYIVSGGTETRVGDTANLTVRFVNNGSEAVVNVVATLDGNQDLGAAEGIPKTAPDYTSTGEIDYGEAEGAVIAEKADRQQSNSLDYGKARVSEVRLDAVDWFVDEGTATGTVKNTTDESDTNNHDMGDATGTITITTGE